MTAYRAGQLSAAIVFPQVQELEAERAEAAELARRAAAAKARPQTPKVEDLDSLDVDRTRAIVEATFEAIVVAPASHRGEPFNPGRLTYVWRKN